MLSDDDSLFGDDSVGDEQQTSAEIPKLALPSLKQSFPPTRPSRGDAPQPLITTSISAPSASSQHLTDQRNRALTCNTRPRRNGAGKRATEPSTSDTNPYRPKRTTRRRQTQSSQQPPPPTSIPEPLVLSAPQPHLQPLLNVLRSDESITSILTALLAHLKENADQSKARRRPIKRMRLDSLGREITEEEWRISRTRQLVAILSSALKRVMDRTRLTEAIASADDPMRALDDVVRTAQDEMEYQRTIGKWLMDKQLVRPEGTPSTTPGPSTPGSAPVTYMPLAIDTTQSKQPTWQPLPIGLPAVAVVDASPSGHMMEEFGLGMTSGDEYWSDLIRLLDNYGAAGVQTAHDPARMPALAYPLSTGSAPADLDIFSQFMQMGSTSSSTSTPFDGTPSSYAPSPDVQAFAPPSQTPSSSHATTSVPPDSYMGMQIDPALMSLSCYTQPPAQPPSVSETPPTLTTSTQLFVGMGILGDPPQQPAVQSQDIDMADDEIAEVEASAKSKGKQKEVVWAEGVGEARTPAAAAQRKTRMRSVLERARAQRQRMQTAMDDALRQLWELEIEHATLAKVVKGVTMKEAVLSKK